MGPAVIAALLALLWIASVSAQDILQILRVGGATAESGPPVPPGDPSISDTSPLPTGTAGTLYGKVFTCTDGTPPYTWTQPSGTLPSGLSLSPVGNLSGTLGVSSGGNYSFEIRCTDAAMNTDTDLFQMTVALSAPSFTTATPVNGCNLNVACTSSTLVCTGGVSPYTFTVTGGALPTGMTLNSSSGLISGTPTVDGTFPFTARCTDTTLAFGQKDYTIVVSPNADTFSFTSPSSPFTSSNKSGLAYSVTTTIAAGVREIRCSTEQSFDQIKSGPRIYNDSAPYSTTVSVTSNNNSMGLGTFTYICCGLNPSREVVSCSSIEGTLTQATSILTAYGAKAQTGVAYSFEAHPEGGSASFTWDNQSGGASLGGGACTGLSITTSSSLGLFSGTPTTAGTCNAAVRACGSDGTCASATIPIAVQSTPLPGGDDFYDTLVALPEELAHVSFRSQAEIDSYLSNTTTGEWLAGDDYATVTIYPTAKDLRSQLRVLLNQTTGTVLNTWDFMMSDSRRPFWCRGGSYNFFQDEAINFKEYQFGFKGPSDPTSDTGGIDTETSFSFGRFGDGCTYSTDIGDRLYPWTTITPVGNTAPSSASTGNPPRPTGCNDTNQEYLIRPNVWYRVWFQLELNLSWEEFDYWDACIGTAGSPQGPMTSGTYHRLTKWIWGENDAAPTRLLWMVPNPPVKGAADHSKLAAWWVELDTSSSLGLAYQAYTTRIRNYVALYNYALPAVPETDTTIFQVPYR